MLKIKFFMTSILSKHSLMVFWICLLQSNCSSLSFLEVWIEKHFVMATEVVNRFAFQVAKWFYLFVVWILWKKLNIKFAFSDIIILYQRSLFNSVFTQWTSFGCLLTILSSVYRKTWKCNKTENVSITKILWYIKWWL